MITVMLIVVVMVVMLTRMVSIVLRLAVVINVVDDNLMAKGPIAVAFALSEAAGLNRDQKRPVICIADVMQKAFALLLIQPVLMQHCSCMWIQLIILQRTQLADTNASSLPAMPIPNH